MRGVAISTQAQHYDAVLISVPPILLHGPHLAPALLKAYAAEKGYSVKCINPSPELHTSLPEEEARNWPYNDFEESFKNKEEELYVHIDSWIEKALQFNPRVVGLSTHAWSSLFFLRKICSRFKELHPDITLILGGPPTMEMGSKLKNSGFIDHFVVGDGEDAFISILKGTADHPNVDGKIPTPISNEAFENLPIPDFSDSDFEITKQNYASKNRIYLIGSRGCVFNCSFCNVPSMTQKFRYKSGLTFAKEVYTIQRKYNPLFIELADSLINGSMKIFREFLHELIILQEEHGIKPKLDAFFRVRPERAISKKDFALMAKAGIARIRIGVESGSYDVREHIGKKETNEDIFYTLEECKKNGIGVNLLMLVGYVNETEERYQDTLQFLQEIKDKELDLTIDTVVVNELYISEGTRLRDMSEDLKIKNIGVGVDEKTERLWSLKMDDGIENTSELRLKRVAEVKKFVEDNYRSLGKLLVFSSNEESCQILTDPA